MTHTSKSHGFSIGLVLIVGLLASCSSCSLFKSKGDVKVDQVRETIVIVAGRHDAYVSSDVNLSASMRDIALQQSATLVSASEGELLPRLTLKSHAVPVCDRHDMYVLNDVALSDLERSVYLRSTDSLRAVYNDPPAD